MKKRTLTLILAVILAFGLLTVGTITASAETYKASVTVGSTVTEYSDIAAAVAAAVAAEGSTLKLLDKVTYDGYIYIESGKFTIDLNGKIWENNSWSVLEIRGTADVKITDTSSGQSGVLRTTAEVSTIYLYDSAKLEIAAGTVENTGYANVIKMSDFGVSCDSRLTVSGGRLTTNGTPAITAKGRSVTITGGTLESTNENIDYFTGTIDLSSHPDPTGIIVLNAAGADVITGDATKLPNGYVFYDSSNNAVTTLAVWERYTVGKAPVPHTVTVNTAENGTVTVDKTTATRGEKVTITLTPDSGYDLYSLTVSDGTNEIEIYNAGEYIYTFRMPDADVTVSATFEPGIPYVYDMDFVYDESCYDEETGMITLNGDDTLTVIYYGEYLSNVKDDFCILYYTNAGYTLFNTLDELSNYDTISYTDTKVTVEITAKDIAKLFKWGDFYGYNFEYFKGIGFYIADYYYSGGLLINIKTDTVCRYIYPTHNFENGTIFASDLYPLTGDTVSLRVAPDEGYELESLIVDGVDVTDKVVDGRYSFTVGDHDIGVSVTFTEEAKLNIYKIESKNGEFSVKERASEGQIVTLAITPAPGYKVKSIIVIDAEGNPVTVGGTSFKMPATDVTVQVIFEVDYSRPVWVTLKGTAAAGETVTLTSLSDTAYGVQTVVADENGNYSFTMIKFLTGGTYTFTVEHDESVETVVVTVTDVKDQLYASVTGSDYETSIERDIETWSKLLAIAE